MEFSLEIINCTGHIDIDRVLRIEEAGQGLRSKSKTLAAI